VAPGKTRRQAILELLRDCEWSFDDLRRELGLTVKVLEEDLKHIQRSVRAGGQRLVVKQPHCQSCDFVLKSVALHPPGRCPSCHDRHIAGPWLHIQ
jgi:predicted Zn-ribbon and HTH transcriptional regulator